MKKLFPFMIVTLFFCLCLTGCGSKDDASNSSDKKTAEAESSQTQSTDNDRKSYTLISDQSNKSVTVTIPSDYKETDELSDTWLNFEYKTADSFDTQIVMYLSEDGSDETANALLQEVQYASSANADGNIDISDIKTSSGTGRTFSYFTYSYSCGSEMTDGAKIWTDLENGTVLVCTYESFGTDIQPLDVDFITSEMINISK